MMGVSVLRYINSYVFQRFNSIRKPATSPLLIAARYFQETVDKRKHIFEKEKKRNI